MEETVRKCVIVIPAYDPPATLSRYVRDLKREGFQSIVVVDDGSGADFLSVFDEISPEAVVLRHDNNRGKGAALKTAFLWITRVSPSTIRYPGLMFRKTIPANRSRKKVHVPAIQNAISLEALNQEIGELSADPSFSS